MFHILRCEKATIKKWTTTRSRPFWRIYWNETPGALIKCSENEVYCDKNNIICIPPALNVEQILLEPFEHLWIHVDTPLLSEYELKIYEFPVDISLIQRMKKLTSLSQEGKWETGEAQILKQLMVYWFLTGIQLKNEVHTLEVPDLVKSAIKIMDERIQSGISTEELATNLGVSSKTLTRQFKKSLEMPPHKFFTSLRIKKATAFLFSKKMSLDQISYECGFCNRSHFSRAFRESYNQSPAAFRKDQSG